MTCKSQLFLTCAAFAVLALASQARAQAPGASATGGGTAAAEPANTTIAEIVVTANKREENLQHVADSVAVVTNADLQRQGVKDFADLSKVVPDLQVQPGFPNVILRGVRTGVYSPTTDSPNAIHVDGVYMSRFTSLEGLFFDAQRIEVLEGPQGTLYGRNSAGGTINIITNKPTEIFGGSGSIEYGNYNAITTNLAINVPLTDNLAVRGAYYHNSHTGYFDNGLGDAQVNAGRFELRWRPTPDDTLLITGDQELKGGRGDPAENALAPIIKVLKQPAVLQNATTGAVTAVSIGTPGSVTVPIVYSSNPYKMSASVGNLDLKQDDTRSGGVMAQYDHDLHWATLTAQAAYRSSSTNDPYGTTTGFPQDPRLIAAAVVQPTNQALFVTDSAWNSQELRLTSPSNQAFTYVVGLYRFQERTTNTHQIQYLSLYSNGGGSTGQRTLTNTLLQDGANPLLDDEAYAAFGQATYTPPVLPNLHITGGLRYNDETKHGTGYQILGGSPVSSYDQRASWAATTYKANIAYDLTPQNMVYFDHSTGFKSGGFAFGVTPQYPPETIRAYEIGSKNQIFGRRLQVDAAAWYYDYRNMTEAAFQYFFDPSIGRINAAVNPTTATAAQIYGQSITIRALVTPDDIIDFGASHTRAIYTKYDLSAANSLGLSFGGFGPGAVAADFNYNGTPIAKVPDWALVGSYDHIFHVWGGDLDAQAVVRYTGRELYGAPNQAAVADVNEYILSDPYATGDLSLKYQPKSHDWSVTAYVRNVTNTLYYTNKSYVSNASFLPANDPRVTFAYMTGTPGQPRTFGVIFAAQF